MELSPPAAPRQLRHDRRIQVRGYERDDGLFDVEAELLDTRPYDVPLSERPIPAGSPLHMMKARLTVNLRMEILAAEAVTLYGPYNVCPGGAASFSKLVGLTIKSGFLRAANEVMGGAAGCTHIREFLQQMATVAHQATFLNRWNSNPEVFAKPTSRQLNSCFAYDTAGERVKSRFPEFYDGPKAGD
jgi:hypothetical protein